MVVMRNGMSDLKGLKPYEELLPHSRSRAIDLGWHGLFPSLLCLSCWKLAWLAKASISLNTACQVVLSETGRHERTYHETWLIRLPALSCPL